MPVNGNIEGYEVAVHLGEEWRETWGPLTIDSSVIDQTADASFAGWELEVLPRKGSASTSLRLDQTANANGSRFIPDGTSATLLVEEADIEALGRGAFHYNVYFTYAGRRLLADHGALVIEG